VSKVTSQLTGTTVGIDPSSTKSNKVARCALGRVFPLGIAIIALVACGSPPRADTDAGRDGGFGDIGIVDSGFDANVDAANIDAFVPDAAVDAALPFDAGPVTCEAGALDVLFVVDPSVSVAGTVDVIASRVPAFLETLFTGVRTAPTDMHVGVITTSLGLNGRTFAGLPPSCSVRPSGDDAVLQTTSRGVGCPATHAPFLTFRAGDDRTAFAAEIGCALQIPTLACSIEQPLEAALKALTPSTWPTRFAGGTTGQADRANAGFRRPGAGLTIIIVSEEDDCSNDTPDFFDPAAPYSPIVTRCAVDADRLFPVMRYVDGFLALAPPSRLSVSAVAGFASLLGPTDYARIRADSWFSLEIVDNQVRQVCIHDFPAGAAPAFRLLDVVEGIDAAGVVGYAVSICSASLGDSAVAPLGTWSCPR